MNKLFWTVPLLVTLLNAQSVSFQSFPSDPAVGPTTEPLMLPRMSFDLLSLTNGGLYPHNGGMLTINGVPFQLGTIGPSQHTGALLATTDPSPWSRFGKSTGLPSLIEIPVNRDRVTDVYVLLNSTEGTCGRNLGQLDFVGADRRTWSYPMVEGVNIRDHNQDRFCNTKETSAGTANFGNRVRLDMQRFRLNPSLSSEMLTKIVFTAFPGTQRDGTPFITGITTVRLPQEKPLPRGNSVTSIMFDKIPDVSATFTPGREADKKMHNTPGPEKPVCMQIVNSRPCTPEGVTLTKLPEGRYHIILPANLAAQLANPSMATLVVSNATGTVCWDRSEDILAKQLGRPTAYCNNIAGNGNSGGRGFMSPKDPAGKLIYKSEKGYTMFFVNGRVRNAFKGRGGRFEFRDHDGFFEFDVYITPQSNYPANAR